jgi:hypothetical protein
MEQTLLFVESLSRKFTGEIGFIPRSALDSYVRRGHVDVAFENGDPCGFLLWGGRGHDLRIFQACVEYDAQRRRHGYDLVSRLVSRGLNTGRETVSLWCRDGLESNFFWRSIGFEFTGSKMGGHSRGRLLNQWRLPLKPRRLVPLREESRRTTAKSLYHF